MNQIEKCLKNIQNAFINNSGRLGQPIGAVIKHDKMNKPLFTVILGKSKLIQTLTRNIFCKDFVCDF